MMADSVGWVQLNETNKVILGWLLKFIYQATKSTFLCQKWCNSMQALGISIDESQDHSWPSCQDKMQKSHAPAASNSKEPELHLLFCKGSRPISVSLMSNHISRFPSRNCRVGQSTQIWVLSHFYIFHLSNRVGWRWKQRRIPKG